MCLPVRIFPHDQVVNKSGEATLSGNGSLLEGAFAPGAGLTSGTLATAPATNPNESSKWFYFGPDGYGARWSPLMSN